MTMTYDEAVNELRELAMQFVNDRDNVFQRIHDAVVGEVHCWEGMKEGFTQRATDLDAEIARLKALVRLMRSAHAPYTPAHEREWETKEQERRREEYNAARRDEYDAETERLINGGAQ